MLGFNDIENYSHYCSKCDSSSNRVFSPPAVIYNGPGFSTTDSRDHGQGERIKHKAQKIKDLWKSNPKLKKKASARGQY